MGDREKDNDQNIVKEHETFRTKVWCGRKEGNVDRDWVKFLGLWSFTTRCSRDFGRGREFTKFSKREHKYLNQFLILIKENKMQPLT